MDDKDLFNDATTVQTGADCEDTITIDLSDIGAIGANGSYQFSNYGIGTSSGMNGSYLTSGGASAVWTTNNTSPWSIGTIGGSGSNTLQVTGDAEFDGDVKIKGVSIAETLDTITKRLAILVPDPAKLEHFAALKKAYEHYKTLEALCEVPEKKDDGS
jgi:hypothetical protein